MMRGLQLGAAAIATIALTLQQPVHAVMYTDMLVREYPMVHSHDAGTGYLPTQEDNFVINYAKNQERGLIEQLDCGARAFDIRPYRTSSGGLKLHHGIQAIDYNLTSALDDVREWAEREENHDELILLTFQKCANPSRDDENDAQCRTMTYDAAVNAGYHVDQIIMDCSAFSDMTVQQGLTNGRKHFGSSLTAGILLMIGQNFNGCGGNSYDPTVSCFIENDDCTETSEDAIPSQHFDETVPLPLFDLPGQRLYDHIIGVTDQVLGNTASNSPLIGVSAHFQYTLESMLKGLGSSIIKNEAAFNVNARTACWIREGYLTNINLVLVDDVCNAGMFLRDELLKYKNVEGLSSRIEAGDSLQCDPVRVVTPTTAPTLVPTTVAPTTSSANTLSPSFMPTTAPTRVPTTGEPNGCWRCMGVGDVAMLALVVATGFCASA